MTMNTNPDINSWWNITTIVIYHELVLYRLEEGSQAALTKLCYKHVYAVSL